MSTYNEIALEAITRALEAAEECYYAFNHLSIVTRVNFSFATTDLHEARKLLQAWKEELEKGEGE